MSEEDFAKVPAKTSSEEASQKENEEINADQPDERLRSESYHNMGGILIIAGGISIIFGYLTGLWDSILRLLGLA